MTYRERVFTFGADGILMGVLTEPPPELVRKNAPAVVVSNVGLNPRIGPQRVWVHLARSLASLGFTTLRFDLNGLGDSLPRRDARSDIDRAEVDLKEALDFLQKKRGFSRFALVAMCSGVDPVHRVAKVDSRVAAAVFLDGYTYETRRSKFNRDVVRRFSLDGLSRTLRRRLPQIGGAEVGEAEEIYVRDYPEPAQFCADLEAMLARDAKLLFIYSGGVWLTFNYAEQFAEMLPTDFTGRVEVEYRREADHTYMIPSERERMVQRVSTWVARHFGG
ncbi:MAG: hypothetical protein U0228_27345 [Myxococcaceae bacterium]